MKLLIANLLILLLLISGGCASGGGALSDFTKDIYTPEHASGFRILGAEGRESVLIRSENPWQGAKGVVRELLILRGGESAPHDFKGEVLHDDASRIVCMSSGHMAMASLLGASEAIVGGSGLDYVTSDEIRSRRAEIAEVGYDGAYDYEAIVGCRPDLVVLYGVNGANPIEGKLKELGIPFIYVGDYLEKSPLGKTEWLVVLGECLGKREEATAHFKPIRDNYIKMQGILKNSGTPEKPKVMLNAPYGDSWFMPPAKSYMSRLVSDAGGEYLFMENDGNSSKAISMEKARMLLDEADVWLNVGADYATVDDIRRNLPVMAGTRVVRTGAVYDNTFRMSPGGGNDFYESGIIHPDLILRDLIKIFHPELVEDDLFYYRRLPGSQSALSHEDDAAQEMTD